MHPTQQEGDRAVVYAVVGERWKRINIRRYARTGSIRASVRPKVPCWQGDFEFSYPGDHSYLGWAKGLGFTELEKFRTPVQWKNAPLSVSFRGNE